MSETWRSGVTDTGKAISERVESAMAATTAAASRAQKMVEDATAATAAAAGQAKEMLGEAARQAWSQAGGVAEDAIDAGRRASRSISRHIHESPLTAVLAGFALGYVASLWIHGGGTRGKIAGDNANTKARRHRKTRAGAQDNETPDLRSLL